MSGTECSDLSHCECVNGLYKDISELKEALSLAYKLLPDGYYGEELASVKSAMTKYDCWPKIHD